MSRKKKPDDKEPTMPFGKHKGKTLAAVLAEEPSYLCWFMEKVEGCGEVKKAIAGLPGFREEWAKHYERKRRKEATTREIAEETVAPSLRAGAAAVDITPRQFPLNMPGGFSANMADRAHDPLHCRALVLDDGVTMLAIAIVDNLGVAGEAVDEAKALASKRCGIAVEKMLVSSTHTHSAPPSNVKQGPAPAVAYRKVLVEGIAESIIRAHARLRPAAVGAAAHPLPEEVFNRRWFVKPGMMQPNPFGRMDQVKTNPGTSAAVLDRPAGPTDPDITVLSVQEAKSRRPLALVANYSLHYVGGTPRAAVSADYYGEFARLMPSRVGTGEREVTSKVTHRLSPMRTSETTSSKAPPSREPSGRPIPGHLRGRHGCFGLRHYSRRRARPARWASSRRSPPVGSRTSARRDCGPSSERRSR